MEKRRRELTRRVRAQPARPGRVQNHARQNERDCAERGDSKPFSEPAPAIARDLRKMETDRRAEGQGARRHTEK